MSINKWRYVRGTDDGCTIYACLQCYGEWESRTSPGYRHEGVYHPQWHFCPICGTKWLGQLVTDDDECNDNQVGPRRRKIRDAKERRHRADTDAYYALPHAQRGPYPGHYAEPYWIVCEMAERGNHEQKEKLNWEARFKVAGLGGAVQKILAQVRDELRRKQGEEQAFRDKRSEYVEPDPFWEREFFYRIIFVRDLEKKYGTQNHIYEIRK